MLVECSARVFQRRNNPRYAQIAFITRFWWKWRFISLPFDIFRRFNALFTALCLWNAAHAVSSVETIPDTHKSHSLADFDENEDLFLSHLIYLDVLTLFSLHYACGMQCMRFPASKQAHIHANRNHLPILTKIKRCFSPVWDISTFKRSVHCIMRAECSARVFQRRNKPRYTQIIIICRFCRKLSVISLPFQIFKRFNALFSALCLWNAVHVFSSVEVSPDTRKSQSFADFDEN